MRPARTVARALFAAVVGAQVLYPRFPERRRGAATRGIVGLLLAASAADAFAARGRRGAATVAAAGSVGFATELVGVATGRPFGHYHYGDGLGVKVGGVPLMAAAAWALLARPAWVVAGLIDPRPVLRVPLAAGALTAWDVFLDPRMAADGFWTWPQGGRYQGIPASN
ncbi:MAG: carotenoid biosynthesis protein, partial [Solirubrobacteraceae bacterium]